MNTITGTSIAPSAGLRGLHTAAAPSAWSHLEDSVVQGAESGRLTGRKLGSLALATVLMDAIPMAIVGAFPGAAGVMGSLAGGMITLYLASLEEHYIGVGKFAGGAVGTILGGAAGAIHPGPASQQTPAPIQLAQRAPTGRTAFEPLLPRLLHKIEGSHVPARTRTTEMAEGWGILAATTLGALAVPTLLGPLLSGAASVLAFSLVGPLTGMALMGVEENVLGAGRFAGEAIGQAISALHHPKAQAGAVAASPPGHGAGATAWKAFMHTMDFVSEPIVCYLLDASSLLNTMFREKAWQTMAFAVRPAPDVNRDRLLQNFVKLAGIPGTWRQEQVIGKEIEDQLDALGIPHQQMPDGTIIGTVAGTVKDAPTVVLSAHQDTVQPTSAAAMRVGKNRIATNGTHVLGGDDRAGVAEILEGVRSVLEHKLDRPELKLVFTVGEEAGLKGSAALNASDVTSRPALGFVVDSTAVDTLYLENDAVIVTPNSVKYNFSQEDPLVQVAMKSMADAGTKLHVVHAPVMAGAGSDANTPAFNSGTIHSMAVGAGEHDIHTTMENIRIDDLYAGARHVVGYITNSCDLQVDGTRIVPRAPIK